MPEFSKAPCGLKFGQLLRGDLIEAKKEMNRLFSGAGNRNVGMADGRTCHGRCGLKTARVKVYGTDAIGILESGAVPNLSSK